MRPLEERWHHLFPVSEAGASVKGRAANGIRRRQGALGRYTGGSRYIAVI